MNIIYLPENIVYLIMDKTTEIYKFKPNKIFKTKINIDSNFAYYISSCNLC